MTTTFDRTPDEAPARGKSRTTNRAPRPSKRSLRREIDAFITFLNGAVAIVAPRDALDPMEHAALVKAIDDEAKSNARFRKGLEALLNVTSGGSLWMVVSVIAARRVARHGLAGQFGPIIDDGGAFVLSTINAEPSEAAETMQNIVDMFKMPKGDDGENPADHAADGSA